MGEGWFTRTPGIWDWDWDWKRKNSGGNRDTQHLHGKYNYKETENAIFHCILLGNLAGSSHTYVFRFQILRNIYAYFRHRF